MQAETERRKWSRLPLPIPVFVRSREGSGKDVLELATAVNISAGGALVAVRRPLALSTQVLLEIPTPPSPVSPVRPKATRVFRARAVRVVHAEGYHLTAFKFVRPLRDSEKNAKTSRRKDCSLV